MGSVPLAPAICAPVREGGGVAVPRGVNRTESYVHSPSHNHAVNTHSADCSVGGADGRGGSCAVGRAARMGGGAAAAAAAIPPSIERARARRRRDRARRRREERKHRRQSRQSLVPHIPLANTNTTHSYHFVLASKITHPSKDDPIDRPYHLKIELRAPTTLDTAIYSTCLEKLAGKPRSRDSYRGSARCLARHEQTSGAVQPATPRDDRNLRTPRACFASPTHPALKAR